VIKALVRMYLDSPTRLCRLEKVVEFEALPRAGEWLKLANAERGDYFAFGIRDITHREGQGPEVTLNKLPPSEGQLAAFDEAELDSYVASYIGSGWMHKSSVKNTVQADPNSSGAPVLG
jgi:hypothetical protein